MGAREIDFRRITRELGKSQGGHTATAHGLARVVYHLLTTKESNDETAFRRCDEEVPATCRAVDPTWIHFAV